ncbi:hypothetical protein KA977_02350 [Candidatus Dependentiae bacterium]|nr:hypothetical protein [Candidatus Dependentiae bacterium]
MFKFIYGKLFVFGKMVSLFFIVVSLVIILISAIGYFTAEKKTQMPSFDSIKGYFEEEKQNATDFKQIDERQSVEKLYSDRLKEIIKNYNIGVENYNIVLDILISVPEEHRNDFLSSTVKFINQALEYEKTHKKGITAADMFNAHRNLFFEMLEEKKTNKAEAGDQKLYTAAAAVLGLLFFIIFLCVPVFIAIEENTRKQ